MEKVFFFLEMNQSEARIACGGCLLTDRDKMSNLYRGPSIDASYQVSFTEDQNVKIRRTTDAKSSHCLWQDELKIQQKIHYFWNN